jgi:hypothetical protein
MQTKGVNMVLDKNIAEEFKKLRLVHEALESGMKLLPLNQPLGDVPTTIQNTETQPRFLHRGR